MVEMVTVTQEEFDSFKALVYKKAGIFLKESKKTLVSNRLRKRVKALGLSGFSAYYDFLVRDRGDELQNFIDAITTNETYFFRNDRHWKFFAGAFLEEMKRRASKTKKKELTIWSAAASTGEEPYTIAIALREALPDLKDWRLHIEASDINLTVLEACKEARYHTDRLRKMPPALVERYFDPDPGDPRHFFLRPEIKNMIRFRRHNLMDRPFLQNCDVIFCRNVMIYFDREMKNKVVEHLHDALRPEGYLILGDAEGLVGSRSSFRYVAPAVYQRS